MQTFVVSAAYHDTTGELVDDKHFAVADDVVAVALHNVVCFERLTDIMVKLGVVEVGKVGNFEEFLRPLHSVVREVYALFLFVDFKIHARKKSFCKAVCDYIHFAGLGSLPRNDKRRSRFVNQNAVHFVNDCKIEVALNHAAFCNDHVVPKIVEAEFVVRAVGDVRVVSLTLERGIHLRLYATDGKSQKAENLAHPFFVAAGEIVVDRHDVNAVSGKRVEIGRQSFGEGFAFTGFHFGDTSLMQNDAAHHLNVVRPQAQNSRAGLSDRRKSLGQYVVKRFAFRKKFFELVGFGFKLLVGFLLVFLLQGLHAVGDFIDFFQIAVVFRPEYFCKKSHFSPFWVRP